MALISRPGAVVGRQLKPIENWSESGDWQPRSLGEIQKTFDDWLQVALQSNPQVATPEMPDASDASTVAPVDRTRRFLLGAFQQWVEPLRQLMDFEQSAASYCAAVASSGLPNSLQENLKLIAAVELARRQRYEEAATLFDQVDAAQVLDPAAMLFYQGLCEYRLMDKPRCLATLNRLLLQADAIPRRYRVLAEMMRDDVDALQPDSLDEISRLMDEIRRQQSQYRISDTVQRQEDAVLEKLDKMIDDLEQKRQEQKSAASSSGGSPMEQSQRAGANGEGNVTPKPLADGGSWGDLPPQERAQALSVMTQDLPPHFRDVIEEYFRQLAKEKRR